MQVLWSPQAIVHLATAFDFAAAGNLPAAQRQDQAIVRAIAQLTDFPQLGRPGRIRGTAELVIPGTPYIAAYRVRDGALGVVALLHQARRWPTHF